MENPAFCVISVRRSSRLVKLSATLSENCVKTLSMPSTMSTFPETSDSSGVSLSASVPSASAVPAFTVSTKSPIWSFALDSSAGIASFMPSSMPAGRYAPISSRIRREGEWMPKKDLKPFTMPEPTFFTPFHRPDATFLMPVPMPVMMFLPTLTAPETTFFAPSQIPLTTLPMPLQTLVTVFLMALKALLTPSRNQSHLL